MEGTNDKAPGKRDRKGWNDELQKKLDNLLFTFGREVNKFRKKWKLTAQELALILGLKVVSGQGYISKVENGLTPITLPTMMRLADAFDMEIEIHFVPKKTTTPRKTSTGKQPQITKTEPEPEAPPPTEIA